MKRKVDPKIRIHATEGKVKNAMRLLKNEDIVPILVLLPKIPKYNMQRKYLMQCECPFKWPISDDHDNVVRITFSQNIMNFF